jgi:hypothetical protein
MRHTHIAVLVLLLSIPSARGAVATAPHVRVEYDGISGAQAQAIADTLSAAHAAYAEHFGFDMPGMIHCAVECGAGKPTRLFTDGNDRVFLSLPSADKLARPAKSGTFHLYGLCHELGHVAMYRALKNRDWMTTAAAEGWAHYAGSVVVDFVYAAHGEKLWAHDPYDYRADGTGRLEKQLKEESPSEVARGAGEWQKLAAIVGLRGFIKVFEDWQGAKVDPSGPPPVAAALAEVLARRDADKADALAKWWSGAAPLFVDAREASAFRKAGIDRSKLERRPVKLELDDGKSDGRKSIAGGGHARRFRAPGAGDWYLTGVSIYGARYGAATPPADATFDVALCDAEMKPVAVWKQPYRLFARGQERWVRVDLPPTRVPPGDGGFYVCVQFRPTATQGVFVSFDESTRGAAERSSLVATPGAAGNPFDAGDWMIRAELDRPRDADALGGK